MTCTACERSKTDPTNDLHWQQHCDGCKARALASLGLFADAVGVELLTPGYREALERLFGERWKQGHERVRSWHSRITSAKATRRAHG